MDFKSMAVAASMALAACSPVQDASEDEALRKLNPDPKRTYLITMRIEGAPGPFAVVEGVAHYEVENRECGRYLKIAGTFPDMTSSETFEMVRISEGEYQGRVYADLILDEDYFGRGPCRWRFTGMDGFLRARNDERDTRFRPGMDDDDVYAQTSVTIYFWKERYPRSMTDDFPSFGQTDRSKFASDIMDDDLFTITLTSQEVQP